MEIVKKSNANPDKDYGQNFLVVPETSETIVDSLEINDEDLVLEIGPGLGSLTHFLAQKNAKTTIVDIDIRMTAFLNVIYQDCQNVEIINDDIRRVDISKYTKIIGNLPYNITTELIVYILKNAKNAKKIILMCQTETFNHFFDISGKEYGPTSVLVHLLGTISKIKNVPAGAFYPAPKCGSLVFGIDIFENADYEKAFEIYKLSKQLFLNRRKTIYNNLTNYLKDRDLADSVCKQCSISPLSRPEDISPLKYVEIYDFIKDSH